MSDRILILALLGVALLVAGSSFTGAGASSTADPSRVPSGPVDPANFTRTIDNPWFPLTPGTTLTYQGTKDGTPAERVLVVMNETKVVDGVTCVVVEDQLSLAGRPTERIRGWYAQDRQGNVWSFGEVAQEPNRTGRAIKTEGWEAGLDGALPSFVMEASPTVGHAFAHEYTRDHFEVLSLSEPVTVPYGSFKDALMTKEWTPIERDALAHKYYVRGVGEVRDVAVEGDKEEFVLVSIAP